MRIHRGWLATGLLIFAVLGCNLSKNSNNSNNSNSNANENRATPQPTRRANTDVYVDRAYMAKADNDRPGEETTTFAPGDRTVYCVIELNKAKKGTKVQVIWKAVDAGGSKNETIKTTGYTTNSFEKTVTGHLKLSKDWPTGKYQIEVYINDNLEKTVDYTIE